MRYHAIRITHCAISTCSSRIAGYICSSRIAHISQMIGPTLENKPGRSYDTTGDVLLWRTQTWAVVIRYGDICRAASLPSLRTGNTLPLPHDCNDKMLHASAINWIASLARLMCNTRRCCNQLNRTVYVRSPVCLSILPGRLVEVPRCVCYLDENLRIRQIWSIY